MRRKQIMITQENNGKKYLYRALGAKKKKRDWEDMRLILHTFIDARKGGLLCRAD
jgi:hypothetical protein